jgi:hypothetical protein
MGLKGPLQGEFYLFFTFLSLHSCIVSLSLQITYEVLFASPKSIAIIKLPCSQAHNPAGWRLETGLDSTQFYAFPVSFGTLPYNHFARTRQKETASLLLGMSVCITIV